MSVPYKPQGYSAITPYLIVDGASAALDFYSRVFGAKERMRLGGPGGTIMPAEIEIGDSAVMVSDEFPELNARGPKSIGGTAVGIMLYVEDADAVFAKAVEAGATIERPIQDQFYGDRSGTVIDPFGHQWSIATHIEDVTPEEIERRVANVGSGE